MSRTTGIALFVFYALLVTFASLQPPTGLDTGSYDKAAHFFTYSVFALLAYRVTAPGRQYWFVCIGIMAYSGLLEVAQSFVPGREMSALDFLANISGVVLGAFFSQKILATRKRSAD